MGRIHVMVYMAVTRSNDTKDSFLRPKKITKDLGETFHDTLVRDHFGEQLGEQEYYSTPLGFGGCESGLEKYSCCIWNLEVD